MNRKLYGLGLLIPVVLIGCRPAGPEMGKVRGTVTLGGAAITEGTVQFWPTHGRPARGSIANDGSYELTTSKPNDGAYVGEHRVTIKATKLSQPDPEIDSTQAEIEHFRDKGTKRIRASRVVWVIPRKYAELDTSPLSATVESGTNEIDFDIRKE